MPRKIGTTLLFVLFATLFLNFNARSAVAATSASTVLAQQMYVAYYGRPGDPGGAQFWAEEFDQSPALDFALERFGSSQEYTESFGSLSDRELIVGLYQQMFNRSPEPGGLQFYTERLSSGVATLVSIAKQIADGAQNSDLLTLNNKILVANLFTEDVRQKRVMYRSSDIDKARALLAAVSGEDESVTSATVDIERFTSSKRHLAPVLNLLLGP